MRFGSVCSGIEAASVAWHPLGWRAAWFAEIEPFPSAVLRHHYPEVANLGDMTALPEMIRRGEVEAPDLFCGGTPCQAFSVAGLRRSLDDARGNLSLTFCEIADAIDAVRLGRGEQPAIIFWENVPGVLSTADNAFGCFLAGLAGEGVPLQPAGKRWTDAGCVLGPTRAVAWRTLDAQFFGLAQRRRRVFVVASARDDFDPAAVLFEWEGVRRDSAPSREAGQRVANALTDRADRGGTNSEGQRLIAQPYAVANCLTARMHKGINSTLDEGQTPVVQPFPDVVGAMSAAGGTAHKHGHGWGQQDWENGYCVPVASVPDVAGTMKACKDSGGWSNSADHAAAGYMVPVHAFDARQSDVLQYGDKTGPLDTDGHSVGVLAFDTTQVTSAANRSNPQPGDPCHPLAAGAHAPAVAFEENFHAVREVEVAPAMTTEGYRVSQNAGGLGLRQAMQVRRLTPTECERLQGFPDGYTAIPWRGKLASECPDGPRYKALGNSWAVPVVRWIGARIDATVRQA